MSLSARPRAVHKDLSEASAGPWSSSSTQHTLGSQTSNRLSNVASSDHLHKCEGYLGDPSDSVFAPSTRSWGNPSVRALHVAPNIFTPWVGLCYFLTGRSLHQEKGQQEELQALHGGRSQMSRWDEIFKHRGDLFSHSVFPFPQVKMGIVRAPISMR